MERVRKKQEIKEMNEFKRKYIRSFNAINIIEKEKSLKKFAIEHQKKKEDKTSSRIKNILNCEKEIDSKFHTEKTKIKKR